MEARDWWHPGSSLQRLQRWWHQRIDRRLQRWWRQRRNRDRERRERERRDLERRARARAEQDNYIVRIEYPKTKIKGFPLRDPTMNIPYISFRGIPYADPPIGLSRFQPPLPLLENSYYKYFEARTNRSPCLQLDHNGRAVGSEDCLYLNIAIPTMPGNSPGLLPVMLHIHGGGFSKGSCELSQPGTLVAENMVFVDLNYRLGVFGFLNMHTENCRGNVGMKDIVMALFWVKDNISKFGGNPKNVTISGHGAGGSIVNLLMSSPRPEGLFHKAIIQAGGAYCPWGYDDDDARTVQQLFKKHRRKNELSHAVVESLIKEDAVYLLLRSHHLEREYIEMDPMRISVFLRPSVEFIEGQCTILSSDIEERMSSVPSVPLIAGITEREGYMYFRGKRRDDLIKKVRNSEKFADLLKQNFRWSNAATRILSDRVRRTYFPNLNRMDDEALLQNLSIFMTDLYHRRFYDNFPMESLCKYFYRFDYFTGVPIKVPETRTIGGVQETIEREAAEYGDDMEFVLGQGRVMDAVEGRIIPTLKPVVSDQAFCVFRNMCELWSTFCKTGKPKSLSGDGMEWLPHSEENPRYLHITHKLTMVDGRLNAERWDRLNGFCRQASELRAWANRREVVRQGLERLFGARDAKECFSETVNFLLRE